MTRTATYTSLEIPPEEIDIEVTDSFIFDATLQEIDETIAEFTKLPRLIKWLVGKELNRSFYRLQVMMASFKKLNIKL